MVVIEGRNARVMVEPERAFCAEPDTRPAVWALSPALHGPWRFRLNRVQDETGISGTGHIADGVEFADGTCVLRWVTANHSSGLYESRESLIAIHGHNGKTVIEWIDRLPSEAFKRGAHDCWQDSCENCPFASVGGLEARATMRAPSYIAERDASDYLVGYIVMARELYGPEWQTCPFGWSPALTIGGAQ